MDLSTETESESKKNQVKGQGGQEDQQYNGWRKQSETFEQETGKVKQQQSISSDEGVIEAEQTSKIAGKRFQVFQNVYFVQRGLDDLESTHAMLLSRFSPLDLRQRICQCNLPAPLQQIVFWQLRNIIAVSTCEIKKDRRKNTTT
eukprot:m.158458 g.158458  ORF g.158458 m.158458 type:complete len:145 (+) comp16334_c0_seq3:154-588(+)